jgi:methionine-rich copper-binding protein CopC
VPPVVTSSSPLNNAVNVALNKVVQITFDKNIQFGTNPWIEFVISGTGTVVPFTSSILGNVLSITPDSLLAAGTKFIVVLHSNSITDLQGNGLAAPYTTKFTTTTPPVVTSTNPVNNAVNVALNKVIQITFDKNIQYGTNPWIEFVTSSTGTAKAFTTTISGNVLNITPTTPLAKGTKYIVVLHSNAVTDSTGTAGLASPYTTKFTTTTV